MATTAFVSPQALVLLFLFLLPSPLSPALALSTIHSRPKIGASTPCLHCMHHHVDIDSFPRAMAWNAKSPVRYRQWKLLEVHHSPKTS